MTKPTTWHIRMNVHEPTTILTYCIFQERKETDILQELKKTLTKRERQAQTAKQIYPDYDMHKDWMLWIRPRLIFEEKETKEVFGEIEIRKRNGKKVSFPFEVSKTPVGIYACCASPYLGEGINDEFGIPIKYSRYRDLKGIREIHIKWTLVKSGEDALDASEIYGKHLYMCYKTTIGGKYNRPDNRIFELDVCDREPDSLYLDEDIDRYETVARIFNNLQIYDEHCELSRVDAWVSKIGPDDISAEHEINELYENYVQNIETIQPISLKENESDGVLRFVKCCYDMNETMKANHIPSVRYDVHYFETDLRLLPKNVYERVADYDDGYVRTGTDKFLMTKHMQSDMIRKLYPDYNENKDWVLWLVSDLYYDYRTLHAETYVKTEDRSRTLTRMNYETVESADGERFKLAYPIVYKSFEELEQVQFVDVEWMLIRNDAHHDGHYNLCVEYLKVRYYPEFKLNKADRKAKVYTIRSEDEIYTNNYVEILRDEINTLYYDKFDNVYRMEANVKLDDSVAKGFILTNEKGIPVRSDYRLDKKDVFQYCMEKFLYNMHTATARVELIKDVKNVCKEMGYLEEFSYGATYQTAEVKLIPEWLGDVPVG